MKLTLRDILVVGVSTVIISGASYTLYRDFTRRVEGGERKVIGTIIYKQKKAQRKYSGEVIWEDVTRQDTVYNFDSIRTDEGSSSVIKLKNGSEIELKENTLVLLSLASGSANIDFSRGSISTLSSAGLNISAGKTVIKAGKGKMNLAAGADTLKVNVEKGSATIGDKKINQNQLALIGGDKTSIKEKEFTLTSPVSNSWLLTFGARYRTAFAWKAKKKGPYRLQVSQNRDFTGRVISLRADKAAAAAQLNPGTWYWRVAYGKAGSAYSPESTFTIIKERQEKIISPRQGASFTYFKTEPLISFRWTGSKASASYRLEFSREKNFSKVAKTVTSNDTAISSPAPGAGKWYWRVVNIYPFSTAGVEVKSPAGEFTLSRSAALSPPALLKPVEGYRLSEFVLKGGSQLFNWQGHDDLDKYRIEIAANRDFKSPRVSALVKNPYFPLTSSLPRGKWYWRVTGIDTEGNPYPSGSRDFTVTATAALKTTAPPDGGALALKGSQQKITFAWNDPNRGSHYVLEISPDKNFSPVARRVTATERSLQLPPPEKMERFYWRVSLMGKNNRVVTQSNTAAVTLSTTLAPPVIVYPGKGSTIDASAINALPVTWRQAKGATHYHIRIFHFARGFTRKIVDKEVKATRYTIRDMKILDEGNFSIELKSLKKSEGKTINQSIAQKRYFSLKLSQKLKNPEIISPNVIYIE